MGGVVVEVVVVGWRQKAMSQFVTHVNLDQHSNARAHNHTRAGICNVHYMYSLYSFVGSIT